MVSNRHTLVFSLLLILIGQICISAEQTSTYEAADPYGLSKGRVYDYKQHLMVDTFSDMVQVHQQDLLYSGLGLISKLNVPIIPLWIAMNHSHLLVLDRV